MSDGNDAFKVAYQRALIVAKMGLPVFPCGSNKQALKSGGFHTATTDEKEILDLWHETPGTLIGVPTGRVSGYDILDLDWGKGGDIWWEENRDRLPPTRIQRTKSGGLHVFFNHNPMVRRRISDIAPGVDTLGDGGYAIWWHAFDCPLVEDSPVADWPEWLIDLIGSRDSRDHASYSQTRQVHVEPDSSRAVEHLIEQCDLIRDAREGSKRDTINRVGMTVGGWVAGGRLSESMAYSHLSSAVDSILHLCKNRRHAIDTLRVAFSDGKQKPLYPEIMEREEISDDIAPIFAKLDAQGIIVPEDDPNDYEADDLPPISIEGLLQVDGFLKAFVDYATRTARRPQPFVALAAAIAFVGAIAGRRYRTESDLRTNVYTVSILDSGGGKDHARKIIKRICHEAKLDQYQGGGDIASASALRTSLHAHPARVYMLDEFGDFMGSMLGRKASQHKADVARLLKELYTSASDKMMGTEYADDKQKPRKDIWEPCACIYGTSTPAQFWSAVAGASLSDGLMARFLVFVPDDDYPAVQSPPFEEVPDALIDMAKAIARGSEAHEPPNVANIVRSDAPSAPYTVPLDMVAQAEFQAVEAIQEALLKKYRGTHVTSLASRITENAMKLALISAISRHSKEPIISRKDMAWGVSLSLLCYQTMKDGAERYASENENQARVKMVLECIRANGGKASKSALCKRIKGRLTSRERDEAILSLEESGEIRINKIRTGGREKSVYEIR
ncbi:bifunctional DNA primase/polymerase [Acetobacter sacchari]|uniref:Bifunctional DNA primase/polymerase n=1 Tax=Acetobacter sacchari TaxID=2661687 RepID=A0ABS3M191_9PROT|nr:bifunctional DNA primase/polymerase [Acetobacter sacchari]MBO1361900.1 bifunctional DNA primase/polymerase [Acetobacter sacchari]